MERLSKLLLCLACLAALAACAAEQTTPAPTSADEVAAQPSVTSLPPTATPLPPTATPLPPTATPLPPTATPLPPTATPLPPSTPTATPGLDPEPHAVLGAPDAPITIYEFSDYGCPACRQYALRTFPTIRTEYIDTGKVRYIFKDYPVVSQHGGLAAQAAECAGEQGFYWEMHDQLFANPQEWDVSPEAARAAFYDYAQAYEMDADALVACVDEGRYQADVDRDVEEALEIGWFGTPTFFINRKMLSGAMPPEVFRDVIDRELEGE
jgi:protein-disulfide isomerase